MFKRTVTALSLILLFFNMLFLTETKAQASDYRDISWEYTEGENGLGEIIFAQDKYITVGYDGIKISYDLKNWNTVKDLSYEEKYIHGGWPAIEYNGNTFVVTGLSGGIYTSTDGISWSFYKRPFNFDVSEIIWDGNQFVAVGQYGRGNDQYGEYPPGGIICSANGLDWAELDVDFDWGLEHISYNGNIYVVDTMSDIYYSYDLKTWNQCDIFNGYNEGIEWVKDRFVATRGGPGNILYSYDGINWQRIEQSWDNTMWACAFNGNIFVEVGSDGTIYVSYDGLNWICKTEWNRTDNNFYDIIWTGEKFVILGNKDNLTWVPDDVIKVKLNENYLIMDTAPNIVDGRTLVPIRAVCEALGADVYWFEKEHGIVIVKNDIKLFLTIGDNSMEKIIVGSFNEFLELVDKTDDSFFSDILLDVLPQIIGNRTLLPIRAVCEVLGAKVDWDEGTNTVVITCPQELIDDRNKDIAFFDEMMAYIDDQHPKGTTANAKVTLDDSTKFTETEIKQAADTILTKFPNFIDCELTELWYDEEKSNRELKAI